MRARDLLILVETSYIGLCTKRIMLNVVVFAHEIYPENVWPVRLHMHDLQNLLSKSLHPWVPPVSCCAFERHSICQHTYQLLECFQSRVLSEVQAQQLWRRQCQMCRR